MYIDKTLRRKGIVKASIPTGGSNGNAGLINGTGGGIPIPKVSSPAKTTKYQHGSFPPGLVC